MIEGQDYHFVPKPDMTAFELAIALRLQMRIYQREYFAMPPEAQRHFEFSAQKVAAPHLK